MRIEPIVSVILPAYNASRYLQEAITSVMDQTYSRWELIIINDGSDDDTEQIILANSDPRIVYIRQDNRGVSAARNRGLELMRGDYFCFLDADDVLPSRSLEARVDHFIRNPDLAFVDGRVHVFDETLTREVRTYSPHFTGQPMRLLMNLSERCFFGPTWMIKRKRVSYKMETTLSHGEDLFFYLTLARDGGLYDYVNEPILFYRKHGRSAMRDIHGLYQGYRRIYRQLLGWPEFSTASRIVYFCKMKKIITLSFLSARKYPEALKTLVS